MAIRTLTALIALVAIVVAPTAAAHGGGGSRGFTSTVTSVTPDTPGLSVSVRDADDRLLVVNDTGDTVMILGYEGEPYLELRADGVFRNTRSPATYLNDDRYGKVELPATANPKAPPVWEEVSPRPSFEWHDHRIHWMSETLPPKVAAATDTPQHVFDWKVPGRLGGKPLLIAGTLDYAPPPGQTFPTLLLLPLALLVVGGGLAVWLKRRRSQPTKAPATEDTRSPLAKLDLLPCLRSPEHDLDRGAGTRRRP